MPPQGATRDQRVTLALKYHYLDGLDAGQIRDRFEQEGVGDYARSTIRGYLNDSPKEAVLEQIENEQAHTREQIADRQERLYKRARQSEFEATEDEPITAVVPVTATNDNEAQIEVHDWKFVDVEAPDRPDWAEEHDTIVRIRTHKKRIKPGERYVVSDMAGDPVYKTRMVGLKRDQPDLIGQRFARQEQREHLEAKGEVLGLYNDAEDRQADALEELAEGVDLTLSMEDKQALDEANDVEPDTMK